MHMYFHVYIVVFQWMRGQDEISVMGIVGSVDSGRHGTPSERKDFFQCKAYAPKMATPASPMHCGLSCDKCYGPSTTKQVLILTSG